MDAQISISEAAEQIRRIYADDPHEAEGRIEASLARRLAGWSKADQFAFLGELTTHFESAAGDGDHKVLNGIFELLMGRSISSRGLSSEEMLKRLSDSLNTIFDALNKLVSSIDMTLMGTSRMDETIRKVIGFHVEGDGTAVASLETYLDHIRKAFQIAHEASRLTAQKMVEDVLRELEPMEIEAKAGISKLDPRRKAKMYGLYEERHRRCREWFASDRFVADFLREFENSVQNLT